MKEKGTFQEHLERAINLGNHRMKWIAPGMREEGMRGLPTTGTVQMLILLVEFPDYPHSIEQSSIDDVMYGAGHAVNYPNESLREFYRRSSYGLLDIQGSTLGWYEAQAPRDFYTDNAELLISEIMDYYDSQGHDFSVYDNDSDGIIDYFGVYWTGPIGEWAEFWWGWNSYFGDPSYRVDGKQLGNFSWFWEPSSEYDSVYGMIHETGHSLGLPDYYDYDPGVGPHGGMGGMDMMDGGLGGHNAYSKWVLGWYEPHIISAPEGLILPPNSREPYAVVTAPESSLSNPFGSEYFITQYRDREGNDTVLPGEGLMILHVDATLDCSGYTRYDNSFTEHKLVRVMEADGRERIDQGGWGDAGDFYRPNASPTFSDLTFPSSNLYRGHASGITVSGISEQEDDMAAAFMILQGDLMPEVTITAPLDGSTGNDPLMTFTWEPVDAAGGYEVAVRREGSVVYRDRVDAETTSWAPPEYYLWYERDYQFWVKALGQEEGRQTGPFSKSNFLTSGCESYHGWMARTFFDPPCYTVFPGIAQDPITGTILLQGGMEGTQTLEYDGTNWTTYGLDPAPPVRWYTAMSYDPVNRGILLFGGYDYNTEMMLGDMWFYDTKYHCWIELHPKTMPPPGWAYRMVTDTNHNRVVMVSPQQTWEWDGEDWTLNPDADPPNSYYSAMAYDPVGERVLLYGGMGGYSGYFKNETWEYKDGKWNRLAPEQDPGERYSSILYTNPVDGHLYLFGGYGYTGILKDLWRLEGNTWNRVVACTGSPVYDYYPAGIYDEVRHRLVMIPGYSTFTWELVFMASIAADFRVDSEALSPGQPVQFSDLTEGEVTARYWWFGDGERSRETNPEHIFESSGTYRVTLTISDGEGYDSITKEIRITGNHDRPLNRPGT